MRRGEMNNELTDEEIRVELRLNSSPLSGIKDTEQEWHIGPLSLSKHYEGFRVGFSHPLPNGALFLKQRFDVDGRRGCAILFKSMGDPPLYFTGWVPLEREDEADRWIEFLNDEVARRHAGLDSRGLQPGWQSQEHEYQEELRKAERTKGIPPSKLVK